LVGRRERGGGEKRREERRNFKSLVIWYERLGRKFSNKMLGPMIKNFHPNMRRFEKNYM